MKFASKIVGALALTTSLSSFAIDLSGMADFTDSFDPTDAASMSALTEYAAETALSVIIQKSGVPGSAFISQDTTNPNVAVIYQDITTGGSPAVAAIYQPASAVGNVAVITQK
jgi:hypothetical protein